MKKRGTNSAAVALAAACTAALLVFADSCETTNPQQQLSAIIFPATNISYQVSIQPVFSLACTWSGCHDNITLAGGLSLESYFDANKDPGNIVPGNPNQSKLNQVLERKFLPLHVQPDTISNHIKGIRQWVLEGGRDN